MKDTMQTTPSACLLDRLASYALFLSSDHNNLRIWYSQYRAENCHWNGRIMEPSSYFESSFYVDMCRKYCIHWFRNEQHPLVNKSGYLHGNFNSVILYVHNEKQQESLQFIIDDYFTRIKKNPKSMPPVFCIVIEDDDKVFAKYGNGIVNECHVSRYFNVAKEKMPRFDSILAIQSHPNCNKDNHMIGYVTKYVDEVIARAAYKYHCDIAVIEHQQEMQQARSSNFCRDLIRVTILVWVLFLILSFLTHFLTVTELE